MKATSEFCPKEREKRCLALIFSYWEGFVFGSIYFRVEVSKNSIFPCAPNEVSPVGSYPLIRQRAKLGRDRHAGGGAVELDC